MIVSKTPLRISFFSGGSDMPAFYKQEFGAALSVTINKYVYVFKHEVQNIGFKTMFDDVRRYENINEITHDITREVMKLQQCDKPCTISSISDVLSHGSGLGSSSAFTVGLINCFDYNYAPEILAEKACSVEIDMCNFPIGKQDQYAAAYGGFNLFVFNSNDSVEIKPLPFFDKNVKLFQKNLLLVYSGRGREASKILAQQNAAINDKNKFALIKRGRDKALYAYSLMQIGKLDEFGDLLHESWIEKKQIVNSISDDYFDNIYQIAIDAGARGGKLLGAGGGGFFLFYVNQENRERVMHSITQKTPCKIYDFTFVDHGSTSQLL